MVHRRGQTHPALSDPHILGLVLQRLPTTADRTRAAGVCHSWAQTLHAANGLVHQVTDIRLRQHMDFAGLLRWCRTAAPGILHLVLSGECDKEEDPVETVSLRDQLEVSVLAVLLSGAGQKLQCLAVTGDVSRRLSPMFPVMLSLCAQLKVIHVDINRNTDFDAFQQTLLQLRNLEVLSLNMYEPAEHWSGASVLRQLRCLGTLRTLRISADFTSYELLPDLNAMCRLTALHLFELGFWATHPLLPAQLPVGLRSLQIHQGLKPDDGTLPDALAQRLTGLTALCTVARGWQHGLPHSLRRLQLYLEDSWALSSTAPSMMSALRGLSCLQALVLQEMCGDAWPTAVQQQLAAAVNSLSQLTGLVVKLAKLEEAPFDAHTASRVRCLGLQGNCLQDFSFLAACSSLEWLDLEGNLFGPPPLWIGADMQKWLVQLPALKGLNLTHEDLEEIADNMDDDAIITNYEAQRPVLEASLAASAEATGRPAVILVTESDDANMHVIDLIMAKLGWLGSVIAIRHDAIPDAWKELLDRELATFIAFAHVV